MLAFVHIEVTQGHLDEVGGALAAVPEIIEAFSITGGGDLLTRVVARDNEHLEDVIQQLISLPGVVRTRTEVVLRERVPHRLLPLVRSVGRASPWARTRCPRTQVASAVTAPACRTPVVPSTAGSPTLDDRNARYLAGPVIERRKTGARDLGG